MKVTVRAGGAGLSLLSAPPNVQSKAQGSRRHGEGRGWWQGELRASRCTTACEDHPAAAGDRAANGSWRRTAGIATGQGTGQGEAQRGVGGDQARVKQAVTDDADGKSKTGAHPCPNVLCTGIKARASIRAHCLSHARSLNNALLSHTFLGF